MHLPRHEDAIVPREKIVDYLLSPTHAVGKGKARFFMRFGFTPDEWQVMAAALKAHAAREVTKVEESPFGRRFVIEGKIVSPDGRNPSIRSVWFIGQEQEIPQFVTAYPLR